ncbi:hypothetical protein [Cellulomonas olei]|uniref:hypothetical protein n=1 Tax=Cellulomonas sp. P4 TaxID=3142533 RepID=UPI0031BB6991
MNEELRRLTTQFNDRVWDQAGTVTLLLEGVGDEWEPWDSIAGIAVTSGVRASFLPTEPPETFDGGPGALEAVAPPGGPLVISESWG